ncbi:MAG: bacillithiol biosynthesis cysteine-adding enzyme BshC [Parachlamydiaceae bacterium]|nr:bacillithiol biosynthesis cysteine-adding enzyme BshC [Parachlamydiaceae bacterium]
MRIVANTQLNPLKPNHEVLLPFLGISYLDPNAMAKAHQQISEHSYPRKELISILRKYNSLLGNDTLALHNIERLSSLQQGCVVTGQQLGLMGGPAYTILKGISCLLLARESGAVPIFWLATEDHDVAEIDHSYLLDAYGNLKNFHLSFPKDGRSVEDLKLTEHNVAVIHQFLQSASINKVLWPKINESYAQTMAQVLVQLFAGTGMIFLEPKLLRPLARSFFRREIENFQDLHHVLKGTTSKLLKAGGKEIISFSDAEATNLFLKDEKGHRFKILFKNGSFQSGKQRYTEEDLLFLIDEQPWRFSTNVAARPVLQSLLIPTLAYIAGPTELNYFHQLGDYHQAHAVPMPCIVPRISATLIPAYAAEILAKCKIDPSMEIPSHWNDLLPQLNDGFVQMTADWKQSAWQQFENEISLEAVERIIKHAAFKLQKKIVKSRLQAEGIPLHGLHLLRNLIHPHQKPQERILNWWSFQAYSQENLVKEFLKLPSWMPEGHLYCYI